LKKEAADFDESSDSVHIMFTHFLDARIFLHTLLHDATRRRSVFAEVRGNMKRAKSMSPENNAEFQKGKSSLQPRQ
jgi:hypothetical protein